MKSNRVKLVYSVINPNAKENTLAALKRLAAEKVLQFIELGCLQ